MGMRIAFAGRLVAPLTGAERVPLELLRELVQIDRDNDYLFFLGESAAPLVDLKAPNLALHTYRGQWQLPVPNLLWHHLVLPRLARALKVDVLIVPHNRLPLWKTCAQVTLVHDLAEFHVARKYDAARNVFRKLGVRPALRRADKVVTVSEASRQDIQRFHGVPGDRIVVIPNGLPAEMSGPPIDPAAAREVLALCYNVPSPYIAYVGAIEHPNKNLVRLLEAYRLAYQRGRLPHHLVLAGPLRWQPEVVIDAITRLQLGDRVHCLGYLPTEDLRRVYAGADLVCFVSLWEGFGLPVLEAMAHGTPVVTSRTSSMPEVAGDAALLVDPLDTNDIAQAIGRVLTDGQLRDTLRQAGLRRAAQFSWRHSAKQLLAVFQAVAPRSMPPNAQDA